MCTSFVNTSIDTARETTLLLLKTTYNVAGSACCKVYTTVSGAYDFGGRKVTNLTDALLPETAAKIVQGLYWSAPTMALFFSLPTFYCEWLAKPLAMLPPTPIAMIALGGEENTRHFYSGVRNVCLVHASINCIGFATSGNLWQVISLIQNLSMAFYAHVETQRPTAIPTAP